MKYILYLLFVFPFFGCGSSHLQDNRVRIEFSDSSSKEYELLSVRPDVFIVGEDFSDTILNAKLIPISHVGRVYTGSSAEVTGMLIGIGVGLVAGAVTARAIIVDDEPSANGLAGGIIGIPFAVVGGVIGYLIPSAEVSYDPMNPKDLISIKELARFDRYSEPPELQKLK